MLFCECVCRPRYQEAEVSCVMRKIMSAQDCEAEVWLFACGSEEDQTLVQEACWSHTKSSQALLHILTSLALL